jgi:soluble P-type ATPase
MQNADIAILTVQQHGDRPEELYREADHVVKNVDEVVTIVRNLIAQQKNCDRDGSGAAYKR